MASAHSSNNHGDLDSELTIGDVIAFVTKAKWFALTGMVIGVIATVGYLTTIPRVYERKMVIQIQPSGKNTIISLVTIKKDGLLERLKFSQTSAQVSNESPEYQEIVNSLVSAINREGGTFLKLTTKSKSPIAAQELSQKIAVALVVIIAQFI